MRCDFNSQEYKIVKNFYVRMQITRFFRQGYSIIETDNDEVLAAINPDKTELVVVVINKSEQAKSLNLNLKASVSYKQNVKTYRTSQSENCTNVDIYKPLEHTIIYSAPAQSLTTFIIPLRH